MPFDLKTAKPVRSSGFDPSTARPVEEPQPEGVTAPTDFSLARGAGQFGKGIAAWKTGGLSDLAFGKPVSSGMRTAGEVTGIATDVAGAIMAPQAMPLSAPGIFTRLAGRGATKLLKEKAAKTLLGKS